MKKNSFKEGAFIATFAIIFTKIIGIIYVIPFYKIIGDKGGALYGYAYTMYSTFLLLSTVGVPLAMSKLVSEYNAKGYTNLRERTYKQGKLVMTIFALIVFLSLFIFAKPFAYLILGDIEGGNTIEDVTFVIRVIATALLVIPALSISRGYLQGNKYITEPSISQVIEQVFRVLIVIFGSYITLRITGNMTYAVAVACFGATVGGIFSWLYLKYKIHKNKKNFIVKEEKEEEKKVDTKSIWKKIIKYALPFVLIDVVGNACMLINMFTVVKILVNHAGFSITDAEIVMSTLTTWGSKLTQIVIALATGLVVSLLPHITDSYVKKDHKNVTKLINDSFVVFMYLAIPMTVGLSFLSKPVWELFYGNHGLSSDVFMFYAYNGLFSGLYTVTLTIMQAVDKYKVVYKSLIVEVLTKLILQYPLMILMYKLGFGAYIGNILATIIATLSTVVISVTYMIKKMNISLKETFKNTGIILLSSVIMVLVLFVLSKFISVTPSGRIDALIKIIIFTIVGGTVYFLLTYKSLFKKVIGTGPLAKIVNKFKKTNN